MLFLKDTIMPRQTDENVSDIDNAEQIEKEDQYSWKQNKPKSGA